LSGRRTEGYGRGVSVDGDDATSGSGFEDRAAIPAGAEGGVNIARARARREQAQRLREQHGNVALRPSAGPRRGASPRRHSRAPPSPSPAPRAGRRPAPNSLRWSWTFSRARSRRASKIRGSHIWNLWPRPTKVTWLASWAWARSASGSTM